jgi:hypothetical protein
MSYCAFHKRALAGLILLGPHFLAHAQTVSTSNPVSIMTTAIVGVTALQTARLNVLNLQPVIPGVTAIVCPATLEFYDDTGAMLKQLVVTNISPTAAASLAFKPTVSSTAPGARAQIRAVLLTPSPFTLSPGPPGPVPAPPVPMPILPVRQGCSLMPSLEIVDDSTGATTTFTTDLRPMPAYLYGVFSSILPAR